MSLFFQDEQLKELMQDFYILTGIKIVFFDSKYNELISYPLDKKTFCMYMRENKEFDRKCRICDENACHKCTKTKKLEIYKCHAGLTEAVAPVTEKGKIIGYIMFGQVTESKKRDEFFTQMKDLCENYNIKNIPEKSIQKIKYKNNKQILAASKILDAFTNYIQLKEMVKLSEKPLILKIESYIEENIGEDITPEKICSEFNIGRTQLYTLAKQSNNLPIAMLIRKKRLEKAQFLLKNTDMKIPDIAASVGFSDYNYFLRVFKKEFGISTKKFRKIHSDL